MKFLLMIFAMFALIASVDAKSATASHILVKDEAKCVELKQKIEDGADFGEMAKEFSTCPSGKKITSVSYQGD